jgi:hypothetical protein
MALESVSRRVDAEVPTASEFNELLDALIPLLNSTGLPSTAFPWPLVALGNINMNGFELINASSVGGVIHVNAGITLSEAISTANTDNDTTIVIDAGITATTTTGGLGITGANVTIRGEAGAKIDCVDRSGGAGNCIDITGNNVTIENIEFISSGVGTNINNAVRFRGVEDGVLQNCVFSACHGGVHLDANGATRSSKCRVSGNIFDTQPANSILVDGCDDAVLSDNIGLYIQANQRLIDVDGTSATAIGRITITGNTAHGSDALSIGYEISGGSNVIKHLVMSGNSTSTISRSVIIDSVDVCSITGNNFSGTSEIETTDSIVAGNTMTGGLTLSGLRDTFDGNTVTGNIAFNTMTDYAFTNNIVTGSMSMGGVASVRVEGNYFSNALAVPSTGLTTFLNNTCAASITGVINTSAGGTHYANNTSTTGTVS